MGFVCPVARVGINQSMAVAKLGIITSGAYVAQSASRAEMLPLDVRRRRRYGRPDSGCPGSPKKFSRNFQEIFKEFPKQRQRKFQGKLNSEQEIRAGACDLKNLSCVGLARSRTPGRLPR
jgi:hypothetical protein